MTFGVNGVVTVSKDRIIISYREFLSDIEDDPSHVLAVVEKGTLSSEKTYYDITFRLSDGSEYVNLDLGVGYYKEQTAKSRLREITKIKHAIELIEDLLKEVSEEEEVPIA